MLTGGMSLPLPNGGKKPMGGGRERNWRQDGHKMLRIPGVFTCEIDYVYV